MRYFALILLFTNLYVIKSYMDSCRQTLGAYIYDLNRLNNFTLFGSDDQYDYFLTPCNTLKPNECYGHNIPNEMSCQYQRSFQQWYNMAYIDSKSPWPNNLNATYTESPGGPGMGIVMRTTNGEPCFGSIRIMQTRYICDRTIENPTKLSIVEWSKCDFVAEVRAIQACPLE